MGAFRCAFLLLGVLVTSEFSPIPVPDYERNVGDADEYDPDEDDEDEQTSSGSLMESEGKFLGEIFDARRRGPEHVFKSKMWHAKTPTPTPNPTPSSYGWFYQLTKAHANMKTQPGKTDDILEGLSEGAKVKFNTGLMKDVNHTVNKMAVETKNEEFSIHGIMADTYKFNKSIDGYIKSLSTQSNALERTFKKQEGIVKAAWKPLLSQFVPELKEKYNRAVSRLEDIRHYTAKRSAYLDERTEEQIKEFEDESGRAWKTEHLKYKQINELEKEKTDMWRGQIKLINGQGRNMQVSANKMVQKVGEMSKLASQKATNNSGKRKNEVIERLKHIHNENEFYIDRTDTKLSQDARAMGAEYETAGSDVETALIKQEKTIAQTGKAFNKKSYSKFLILDNTFKNVDTTSDLLLNEAATQKTHVEDQKETFDTEEEKFHHVNVETTDIIEKDADIRKKQLRVNSKQIADNENTALMNHAMDAQNKIRQAVAKENIVLAEGISKVKRDAGNVKKTFHDGIESAVENFEAANTTLNKVMREDAPFLKNDTLSVETMATQWEGKEAEEATLADDTLYSSISTMRNDVDAGRPQMAQKMQEVSDNGKAMSAIIKQNGENGLAEVDAFNTSFQASVAATDVAIADEKREMQRRGAELVGMAGVATTRTGILVNQILPEVKTAAGAKATTILDNMKQLERTLKEITLSSVDHAGTVEQQTGAGLLKDGHGIAATTVSDVHAESERELGVLDEKVNNDVERMATRVEAQKKLAEMDSETLDKDSAYLTKSVEKDEADTKASVEKIKADAKSALSGSLDAYDSVLAQGTNDLQKFISKQTAGKTGQMKKGFRDATQGFAESTGQVVTEMSTELNSALKTAKDGGKIALKDFTTAQSDLSGLVGKLTGGLTAGHDWKGRLDQQLSGMGREQHEQAIISAQSEMGLMSAVESKFRDLHKTIGLDAQDLSEEKQKYLTNLADEMKAAYAKVGSQTRISDDEKRKRLGQLDTWMADEVKRIHEEEEKLGKQVSDNVLGAEEAGADAKANLAKMMAEFQKQDSDAGITHGNSVASKDWGKLAHITDRLEENVQKISGDAADSLKQRAEERAFKVQDILRDVETTQTTDEAKLAFAEASAQKLLNLMATDGASRGDEFTDLSSRLGAFETKMNSNLARLADDSVKQSTGRERQLNTVNNWAVGLQKDIAQYMEKAIGVMLMTLKTAGKLGKISKDKIDGLAKKLSDHLASDQVQLTAKIHHMDGALSSMKEKDVAFRTWKNMWSKETTNWDHEVTNSLQDLVQGLADTDASIVAGGKKFDKTLRASLGNVKTDEEKSIQALKDEQAADAAHEAQLTAKTTKQLREAVAADNSADDNAMFGFNAQLSDEAQMAAGRDAEAEKMSKEIEASLEGGQTEEHQAFHEYRKLMDAKQHEVDKARVTLRGKLRESSHLIDNDLAQAFPVKASLVQVKKASELARNHALTSEHAKLGEEVKRLEEKLHQV